MSEKISERRKKMWRELFDDRALTPEELEEHHRQADEFKAFLKEPEHPRPTPDSEMSEGDKRIQKFFREQLEEKKEEADKEVVEEDEENDS